MKHCYTKTLFFFLIAILIFTITNQALAQSNYVSTYAGTGALGLVNGDTSVAKFKAPFGMCIDASDNLFIADQTNNCIRKITPQGIVSTYAGSATAGYFDGIDSLAKFNQPADLCADAAGNIYVSDFANQYIRKISTDGMVTTIAGNGVEGYVDGISSSAEFDYPRGICIDVAGNLYIGDSWNHRIRKIDVDGMVSTFAGGGNIFGVQSINDYKDGSDTAARFATPCGIAIDDAGNIYVADAYNHCVRKVDPSRMVTTLAGIGSTGSANGGYADGDAATAQFNTLTEVFADHDGNVYVGDTYNNLIRKVSNGIVTTVAGNGTAGLVNGIDSIAEFKSTRGVVLDAAGDHLFVCDNSNHVIRKISLDVEVGIENVNDAINFSVSPNPSIGIFFIPQNLLVDQIIVNDFLGMKIYDQHFSQSPSQINLQNFADGIYLVSFYSEHSFLKTEKVVIGR